MSSLYIKNRLYIGLGIIVILYALIFAYKLPFWFGPVAIVFLGVLVIVDILNLYVSSKKLSAERFINDKLSLSDDQYISYKINNDGHVDLDTTIIDELPEQLQQRDFLFKHILLKDKEYIQKYKIRPTIRGLYNFGKLHIYINTLSLRLIEKRCSFELVKNIEVHPSFIQMKKFDLQIFNKVATMRGLKKIRRIGKTDEFEHIRNYNQGDNTKSINWKATSRRSELMINQFQDTRSQSVYCIVDKGRSMKMPFEELSLLDYAINSSLVLSNIILKKFDKAGLITFNESLGAIIRAENRTNQLSLISNALYNESTGFKESNFQSLYYHVRQKIRRRSVLLLFSNFEHSYDMKRALPYLKQLNKLHLLVVIFFTNTELLSASNKEIKKLSDIYSTTFAQKALVEKDLIAEEMFGHGIQVILSTPNELSINVINKYLEIKAKRML